MKEIAESRQVEAGRIRRPGGGRKAKLTEDSTLLADLERLVEPATRGDPMRPLQLDLEESATFGEALQSLGHSACPHVIADGLRKLGFSLQANRKTREGEQHMDRDAQFHYINDQARRFWRRVSRSSRWIPRRKNWWGISKTRAANGAPKEHQKRSMSMTLSTRNWDAPSRMVSMILPTTKAGSVWHRSRYRQFCRPRDWRGGGRWDKRRYPKATRLLITADGGGSNGHRVRLWKIELQASPTRSGFPSRSAICRPAPANGTKSNIASFLLSRSIGEESPCAASKPSFSLSRPPTTTTGLTVRAELDENKYPKGVKTSDANLPPSTSLATNSTATGTTPLRPTTQSEALFMHNSLGLAALRLLISMRRNVIASSALPNGP